MDNNVEYYIRQIQFISEGGNVIRYHTRPGIKADTDAHHSHGVAMFCHLLSTPVEEHSMGVTRASANLLMAALTHDLGEQVASDVSAPAKRMMGIQAQLHAVESMALEPWGLDFERNLDEKERRILKLADTFDGMMYCVRERTLGNQNVRVMWRRWVGYGHSMNLYGIEQHIFSAIYRIYEEIENGKGPSFDCFR